MRGLQPAQASWGGGVQGGVRERVGRRSPVHCDTGPGQRKTLITAFKAPDRLGLNGTEPQAENYFTPFISEPV